MIKQIGRSLLDGAATLLDLGGTLHEERQKIPAELVDEAAIRSDWEAVGRDLQYGMDQFSESDDYHNALYK